MLTALRRLCGHDSIGPSCVLDQGIARIRSPISPPATNQLWVGNDISFVPRFSALSCVIVAVSKSPTGEIYPRTGAFSISPGWDEFAGSRRLDFSWSGDCNLRKSVSKGSMEISLYDDAGEHCRLLAYSN